MDRTNGCYQLTIYADFCVCYSYLFSTRAHER